MATEGEGAGSVMLGFCHDQEIDQCLLEADEVRQSILLSSGSNKIERGHRELDLVMVRLERQFRKILVSLPSISADDDSSTDLSFSSERTSFRISFSEACTSLLPVGQADDDDTVAPFENLHQFQTGFSGIIISLTPPPEAINYLHRMAEQMVSSGYTQECIQAYSILRRSAVETNVLKLGLERMTLGDIQMLESDGLDKKVRKWIAVATMCVQELFVAEKRLFEQMFEGSSLSTATKHISFIETVVAPTMQLLSFPQAVSRSRRFPEKLFSMLDLHNALSHLLPEIEQIFKPCGWELIAAEAEGTVSRLADAAGFTILEFEYTLLREISLAMNPGGGIHSIAWVKVLNCLSTEGLHVRSGFSSGGVSKSVLRKRFKTFVAMFEEVCRTQATWLVPDIHLRNELRIDI